MKKQKNKQGIKASKLAKAQNMKIKIITVKNAEGEPDTEAEILFQNKINYIPKVSVIIPVYNVEAYLRECLDSVINQTLKEIEIICVDDGSTDNSLEILKEYAKKDNRISVLTQENLHAGVARNAGLAVAGGEYLSFLDSDDFFELNMLEETYNKAKQDEADICIFGSYVYDDGKKKDIKKVSYLEKFIKKSPFNPKEFSKDIFLISSPNAWTKLFKKDIVKENNVFFENYITCNDITFVSLMLTLAHRISLINYPYVHYRINTTKKTRLSDNRNTNASCFVYAIKKLENNLKKYKTYDTYKEALETRIDKSFNWESSQCNKEQKENLKKLSIDVLGKDYSQQPKVSIIVPVYNTAEFLPQCLDSIINQTLQDIEIICVNDGSTDNSLSILQEYAKNDKRIVIINQENSGLSCSRNNALRIATGEYVQFVDSDDYIIKEACQKLYDKCSKFDLDMINFEGINFNNKNKMQTRAQTIFYIPLTENKEVYTGNDFNRIRDMLPISSCRYFYKRKFLVDNDMFFPEKICFEDNYFVLKASVLAPRFGTLREILYYRRIHRDNITQNWSKFFQDYIKIILLIHEMLKKYDNSDFTKKKMKLYIQNVVHKYNSLIPKDKEKYKKEMIALMRKLRINNNILNEIPYKQQLQNWYSRVTGKYLNLDNPRTFNEKIQWLKLYDSTPLKTRLADKYLVRDWVKEKIGEQYLIPLLGVYDKFEDIDFAKLPNKFVIKCNHGSGYNIIVKDKTKLDLKDTKEKLDKWMSENFAFKAGFELHYRDIKPKIIIEEYKENRGSQNLYDYKFWCFNGEVKYMQFRDDFSANLKMVFYDLNWKKQPFYYDHPLYDKELEKPDNFQEMIDIAKRLSQGFAVVCVDLYRLNDGTIYFGEMTFTRSSGIAHWNDEKYNKMLGNMIKLPKLAYNLDTGEYYKLPKKSKIKPWLLLPYNLYELVCLKEKYKKQEIKNICHQLKHFRIDIKNFGNEKSVVEITAQNCKINAPAWLNNTQGQGQVVESSKKLQNITIKAIQDGKLVLSFKGQDKRFEGTRFPVWIDYKSIKIDGKEILSAPVATWHDKPYRYEMPVKDGQVINVEVVQQYHQYGKDELKDVILKLNPNSEYIKENIDKLTDKIYKKITIKNTTIQKQIKLWQDKFSFTHKIAPVMDLMQKNQAQTLRMLQEIQAKNTNLENKNSELKKEIEVLKGTFNTQLSDFKKQQDERSKQLMATGDKISFELQRVTNELQKAGISGISEIKTHCAGFANQLGNTEVKLLNELNRQRETSQQNKDNIIAGINQTEQSLQINFAKFQGLAHQQLVILDKMKDNLNGLEHLKDIDFAQKTELKALMSELETQESHLMSEMQNLQNKAQRQYQELNFADLLHDSMRNSPWLKDKNLALYGVAANYSFTYTLFRILDNVKPAHILEMGLGQTSVVTSQYIANNKPEAVLDIIENDENWIKFYEPKLAKSQNIKLHQCDIEFFDYDGAQSRKYKELYKITKDKKYNLILVDGPFGGAQKFPRSNIVDLVEHNLAQDFIIIFDDAERTGEQNTIAQTKAKLTALGIEFGFQQRNALKSQVLIFSKSCEFAKYL